MPTNSAAPVLVVDDDTAFSRVVEEALLASGHACLCVRTGEEALRAVDRQKPSAVILDGLLPGVRGDIVAQRLRERFPRHELPIVFVTAFFRDLKSRRYLLGDCQVDLVLNKPLRLEDLLRALAQVPALSPRTPASMADRPEEFLEDFDMDDVVADYVELALERVAAMRAALSTFGGGGKRAVVKLLATEAHRFRGSGESHGIPEVTRLATQMERLLKAQPDDDLSPTARAQLTGLVEAMAARLSRSGGRVAIETEAGDEGPLELLLVDDPSELTRLAAASRGRGETLRCFEDVESALAAALDVRPDVSFVGAGLTSQDALDASERLVKAGVGPVVVLGDGATLETRLAAFQRGVEGFAPRPVDLPGLVRLAKAYARSRLGVSVLALDQDPGALAEMAQVLAPHRVTLEPCITTHELFAALARGLPAAVLLDVPGPAGLSLDLIRLMRGDPRLCQLPIIALSSGGLASDRTAAFEAGADDFVSKPFSGEELAARVLSRARRFLKQKEASVADSVTGLPHQAIFQDACERALASARRGRPLALLRLDVALEELRACGDGFGITDRISFVAAHLRRAFRAGDLIAQLAEGKFAVLLPDAARADAVRLLAAQLDQMRETRWGGGALEVVGALASYPEDAGSMRALLAAAEAQLQKQRVSPPP